MLVKVWSSIILIILLAIKTYKYSNVRTPSKKCQGSTSHVYRCPKHDPVITFYIYFVENIGYSINHQLVYSVDRMKYIA